MKRNTTENLEIKEQYFRNRNITENYYRGYRLQSYLMKVFPVNKNAKILDIGCGFGQMLLALKNEGYIHLYGIDISDEAVTYCTRQGVNAEKINTIISYCNNADKKYDFIIMSHVLEHLEKPTIIKTLKYIRQRLMKPGASLLIMVPNAQSNTGCYWAYEDFTHTTLFTSGSLYFVLKSAGFQSVDFIDQDGLDGTRYIIRWFRKILLNLYKLKVNFWNIVTRSSFHRPSPQIFTYEIKAIAK